jgi:hypothetical protein
MVNGTVVLELVLGKTKGEALVPAQPVPSDFAWMSPCPVGETFSHCP